MAGVSLNKPSLGVNTDRVAASSRPFAKKNADDAVQTPSQPINLIPREMPNTSTDSPFVDVDGKRYFLEAPRGTYLNILI